MFVKERQKLPPNQIINCLVCVAQCPRQRKLNWMYREKHIYHHKAEIYSNAFHLFSAPKNRSCHSQQITQAYLSIISQKVQGTWNSTWTTPNTRHALQHNI